MTRLVVAVALLCIPVHATAEDPAPKVTDQAVLTVGIAGLGSFQPGGYESPHSPYLSRNLGGIKAGAGLSLERSRAGQPLMAVEIGTTLSFQALQSGRYVRPSRSAECPEFGYCIAIASHRDTLLSFLTGWRNGPVAVKVGPSVVFGKTTQGDSRYDDAAGHWALTAGFDGVVPVGTRIDLIPGARYSYVFRGPSQDYVGLGSHIVRLTVGLRMRVTPSR
jgi:hypothetical protein